MSIVRASGMPAFFALLATTVSACGGSSTPHPSPPPPPPLSRQVTISSVVNQLAEDGSTTTDVPAPPSSISVVLDDGTTIAAAAGLPGKWTAQVPAGPWWAVLGDTRYRVTGDALDLGYLTAARPSLMVPTVATGATLTLSGLQPWIVGNDTLQLFSWSGQSWDVFDPKFSAAASNGAAFEDWNAPTYGNGALMLLTPADRLYAIQYRKSHDTQNGIDYQHAVAFTSASGLSMTNGQPFSTTLPAMTAPAQAGTVSADWRTTQFEAAAQPFDYRWPHQMSVFAEAMQAGGEVPYAVSPNLLDFSPSNAPSGATPDVKLSSLSYGRPMPPQYRDILYVGWVGAVSRTAAGSPANAVAYAYVVRRDAIEAVPSPLVPLISVVRAVQIAGRDAGVVQSLVGLTPTVSWTPPATGTPNRYIVKLYTVPPGGGAWTLVTSLNLPGSTTSVQVPPGLQQSGRSYYLSISAQAGAGSDVAPLRWHLPNGVAAYATQVYTP